MQRFQIYLMCGALAALLLSSCDVREILPNDLSDPAHARYVASGDKAKDRRQFEAYIFICNDLLQPYFEDKYARCLLDPEETPSSCNTAVFDFGTVVNCASGLVDYHPGARPYEFNDWDSL